MPYTNVSLKMRHTLRNNTFALLQWVVLSVFVGTIIGVVGVLFHIALEYAAVFFFKYPWLLFCLPISGIIIVAIYKLADMENDPGTESVISSASNASSMPLRMAPLIFVSTILTHLTGGSAGREGAALQLGGSIASYFARLFNLDDDDKRIMTMCGMSTGFSALFGTPLSSAVFAMEVESVGIMYYAALVPCVLGALTARLVSIWFGIAPTSFSMVGTPEFLTWKASLALIFLGVICGLTGNLFCRLLNFTRQSYQKSFKNPFVRIVAGALIVISISLLIGNRDYNGAGMNVIAMAINGKVDTFAFIIKMFLTALTLTAGFKGGEIVPAFFIGSTLGCLMGSWLGLNPSFSAAVGLVCLFCGVTNSPMTSIMLSYELFGGIGTAFIALPIAVTFMTSGYHSLYHKQKIVYAKTKCKYIGAFAEDGQQE